MFIFVPQIKFKMKLLLSYLKEHKWIVVFALALAAINIGFSLLDPYFTGQILDRFINRHKELSRSEYVWGVLGLVGLAVGAAMCQELLKIYKIILPILLCKKSAQRCMQMV